MRTLKLVAIAVALIFGTALYYHFSSSNVPSGPSTDASAPTTEQTREGTLDVTAALSHGLVPTDSSETLYGTIDVAASEFEGARRPPLNVALVLDRSGSMHGAKITHVKQAARTIVDMLDPRDRLTIVSYGGTASVEIPSRPVESSNRARMKQAIETIEDAGGTNIAAGVRSGVEQLERHSTDETIDRVVLLSDGKPTIGPSSRSAFESLSRNTRRRDDITLTTMGVGLDYNEDLMAAMADTGGGHYYFIDRPAKAVSIFERELRGLTRTVARDASVVINLGEGVELAHLHGYPHRVRDGRVHVSLSDFEGRETKSILLELETNWESRGEHRAVRVALSYEDLTRQEPAHTSLELTSRATSDGKTLEDASHDEVISRVQQIEVAESLDRAMNAYQDGQPQRARQMLQRRRHALEQTNRRHQLENGYVERMLQQLSETEKTIEQTPSTSAEARMMIKKNKARGHRLMRDKSAVESF